MWSQTKQARMDEIVTQLETTNVKSLSPEGLRRFEAVCDEAEQLKAERDTYVKGCQWRAGGDPNPYGTPADGMTGNTGTPLHGGSKAIGPRFNPPSPLMATEEQMEQLWLAAKSRMPSFQIEIGGIHTKDFGANSQITMKAASTPIAEYGTGPGGTNLFPPVLRPDLTQQLLFEPNRLFAEFPGQTIEGPSIEYLVHSGNANPAAAVPELGVKPDIGLQLSVKTASPTKLAALASVSMEALDDFNYFQGFVPQALNSAIVNVETQEVVSGSGVSPHMPGVLNTSGILVQPLGTDSPLDAIQEGMNAIRVGSSYGDVDLVAAHPSTWAYLRRQKSTQGVYLLAADPSTGQVNTLWGARVVTNTMIPQGTVLLFDSSKAIRAFTRQGLTLSINQYGDQEWTTNSISFRIECRETIGVLRPSAICSVTGLPTS